MWHARWARRELRFLCLWMAAAGQQQCAWKRLLAGHASCEALLASRCVVPPMPPSMWTELQTLPVNSLAHLDLTIPAPHLQPLVIEEFGKNVTSQDPSVIEKERNPTFRCVRTASPAAWCSSNTPCCPAPQQPWPLVLARASPHCGPNPSCKAMRGQPAVPAVPAVLARP